MREFYTTFLGLKEESFQPDPSKYGHSWLSYELGNSQRFVFNAGSTSLAVEEQWSYQPSSEIEGGIEKTSFTMQMPKAHFEQVAAKLVDSNVTSYQSAPHPRQGYVALTVKDPMGNTVDLYYLTD